MPENFIIVGGGVSGLSAASMLSEVCDVTVVEKAEKTGGLIKCEYVSGNLFHKVGGHVFNAKNKRVFDWFWSHFNQEEEFLKARRNARIFIQNKLIGYPIENYLYEFDKETISNIVSDLLGIQKRGAKDPFSYADFEEFLKGNFGDTLYELYFRPYNSKIWNTDLSKVDLAWLEGKLPMPNIKEIFISNIFKEEETGMVHSSFYYPRKGGSQFIADRLSQGLKILNGTPVSVIEKKNGKIQVNGNLAADRVIYTGDIRKLGSILKTDDQVLNRKLSEVSDLKSNGTSNMLCECDENDISWLYIPESFTRAHRIIYTGNFSPDNNNGTARKTCVVEFSGKADLDMMKEEIKKLPGNLTYLSHNYEPNSYVIQEQGTRQRINEIKELLKPHGIYLLGRFAEWEYYNMDKAIEAAMTLSDLIKSGAAAVNRI
jgi:protoporphyrinogen oxidase